MNRSLLALSFSALLSYGCQAPEPAHDWSTYEGFGAEHFQQEEVSFPSVRDPVEPVNRKIWALNDGVLTYVINPLATGYRFVVPQPVRTGVGNFFTNLLFPGRLINNLLQGKPSKAWTETKRFAMNTTVGGLGFWDSASHYGIGKSKEDFGQTFAKWGWTNSSYFVIPFFGPSTFRDTLGFAADLAVDPAFYYPPASQIRNFNRLSDEVRGLLAFMHETYDDYELARLLFVMNRENDVENYSHESEVSGSTDTLGVVFLKPHDPEFRYEAQIRTVVHPATGRELEYAVWLQPGPAKVTYFIPGLGGHHLGSSAVALAEVGYGNGATIVSIPSLMNPEFIANGLTSEFPGFLPVDTHDVHLALDAIDKDLEAEYPGRLLDRRLAGISLGAITTLFIAAAEADPANDLIVFDGYLALNSPINLRYGMSRLDAFFNAPLAYPPEERDERIAGIFRKTLDLAQGVLEPGGALPYTNLEAEFLIGVSFRNTVRDIIFQTQLRNDMGVLKSDIRKGRREATYREITQFSFMEYVYAFVMPYYAARRDDIALDEAGVDRLFDMCDVHSIGDALAANPKVLFVSNKNDFLLREEDIDWITQTLGEEQVMFFERGGHLGNLSSEDVRVAVRRMMREVIDQ